MSYPQLTSELPTTLATAKLFNPWIQSVVEFILKEDLTVSSNDTHRALLKQLSMDCKIYKACSWVSRNKGYHLEKWGGLELGEVSTHLVGGRPVWRFREQCLINSNNSLKITKKNYLRKLITACPNLPGEQKTQLLRLTDNLEFERAYELSNELGLIVGDEKDSLGHWMSKAEEGLLQGHQEDHNYFGEHLSHTPLILTFYYQNKRGELAWPHKDANRLAAHLKLGCNASARVWFRFDRNIPHLLFNGTGGV